MFRTARTIVVVVVLAIVVSVPPVSWWPMNDPARPAAAAPAPTSAFSPVEPCRLADTRSATGYQAIASDRIRVAVAGRCGVPDGAVAVSVNVTVVDPVAAGFVTVWPGGAGLPDASSVNFGAGEVRANGIIVALGADGSLDVRPSVAADLLLDVTGSFSPTQSSSSGRFVPLTPTRAFDSREAGVPVEPGGTVRVPLPSGVPSDALALAVNVTTTGPNAPGYVTLHRPGASRPDASVLNTDDWNQTRSAASIAPVDAEGLAAYVDGGGHVIVDVTGWFTGSSAAKSAEGLFVPMAPLRLLDTRSGDPLWAGGSAEIPSIDGAAAVALNLTATGSDEWSFVTAHPARTPRPATSSVNVNGRGDTAANFSLVAQSSSGVAVVTYARSDVMADIAGWFTGSPSAGVGPAAANVRPPVCLADPSFAGIGELLRSDLIFHGADTQRTTQLPGGRVLWTFQDVHVPTRLGPRLVHNAALLQDGSCFHLLHGGTYANPTALFMADETVPFRRWYWPLGSTVGAGGDLYVFLAEMHERGRTYLDRTEPTATWLLRLDAVDLTPIHLRPAPNATPSLYGWSVVDLGPYTYLYAQCHRQFGFDPLVFSDPLVFAHDFSCAGRVTVARVPRGDLGSRPQYWQGTGWGPDPARAVAVIPTSEDRQVNPTQVHHDGSRFVAVTKEGDWWGDTIYVDAAPAAQGPWRTIAAIPVPPRCSICNTYFASFLAPPAPGRLVIGLSNNVFPGNDLTAYFPSILELRVPS